MTPYVSNYAKIYNLQKLIRVYTYYRVILGCILLLLLQLDFAPNVIGRQNDDLMFYTCIFYTLVNVTTLFLTSRQKLLNTQKFPFFSCLIDIVILSYLMHLGGGALTGLGYLLLVTIAAGGMMLRERTVVLLAAITSMIVIAEGLYRYLFLIPENRSLFSSALLGTLAFVTAIAFHYFSQKLRTSEVEAIAQAEHIAHLQRLAQLILERMRTGIMVLNKNQDIALYNKAAMRLLDLPVDKQDIRHLSQLPELFDKWNSWKDGHPDHSPLLSLPKQVTSEIKVNFAELEPGNESEDYLVFLEDVRSLHQQAQHLKLASLGRLTASIAHEIRNPLGAISHASQLLSESQLNETDHRLLEMIQNHSKRVNSIIENILQLSRRRASQPEKVDLRKWLPHFINEYKYSIQDKADVTIDFVEKNIDNDLKPDPDDNKNKLEAKFDTGQLQQVLTNLCDNGLRYTQIINGKPSLRIETGTDKLQQQPYIRVIDYGKGIAADVVDHLFEPFFTTENTGSGLGLYICKELCEANQAFINYQFTPEGESCFHIQLSHPEKLQ
jgi:two-component system, NtrC family, sensor histidine kinase PilS